jgi:hypothetical protein
VASVAELAPQSGTVLDPQQPMIAAHLQRPLARYNCRSFFRFGTQVVSKGSRSPQAFLLSAPNAPTIELTPSRVVDGDNFIALESSY